MDINLFGPIELDFQRVGELEGVGARRYEIGEDGIVFFDGDSARSIFNYRIRDADCAEDAEGWGGEAEAWAVLAQIWYWRGDEY